MNGEAELDQVGRQRVRAAKAAMPPPPPPPPGLRGPWACAPARMGREGPERDPRGSASPSPFTTRSRAGTQARRGPRAAGLRGAGRGGGDTASLKPVAAPGLRGPAPSAPPERRPQPGRLPVQHGAASEGATAAELRKSLKPLLEKRRRARINESLRGLRALVPPLLGLESSGCSRLEKAVILEMTVRFLRELPAPPSPAAAPAPSDSFRQGYRACLASALPACGAPEPALGRLLEHLRRRVAASPAGGRPEDPWGSPPPSAPPTPAPLLPACPRGAGLWRPW